MESVPVECQHFLECLCWLAVMAMKSAAQKVSYDYYHCSHYYYFSCKDMNNIRIRLKHVILDSNVQKIEAYF